MSAVEEKNLRTWIACSHLLGVKTQKLLAWFQSRGEFASLFSATATELQLAGFTVADLQKINSLNWSKIEAEQAWYAKQGQVLSFIDPRYPALLKEIADPPLVLYVLGEVELLAAPQLAMVGSRNPSPLGRETAAHFAKALAQQGLVITSGLALGIDGACHEATLAAGGKTVAVLGSGLNQIYPPSHRALAEKVREQGALISEFPLNTAPAAWNFPRRNRIISGLSLGVLVVEAALRSGSLITARFAMEQNREVFAIPGSIHQPQARGCHQLLRQGAKLVEAAQDILEELESLTAFIKTVESGVSSAAPVHSMSDLAPEQQVLLKQIDFAVTAFDTIHARSGLTATEVSSMLLGLELAGYVQALPGGYIRCAKEF